jgi:hypothetical protein
VCRGSCLVREGSTAPAQVAQVKRLPVCGTMRVQARGASRADAGGRERWVQEVQGRRVRNGICGGFVCWGGDKARQAGWRSLACALACAGSLGLADFTGLAPAGHFIDGPGCCIAHHVPAARVVYCTDRPPASGGDGRRRGRRGAPTPTEPAARRDGPSSEQLRERDLEPHAWLAAAAT